MRRNSAIMVFVLVALVVPAGARASRAAQGSPAADPVIVRIEGSVILQSQMSKLAALQMLTQGVPDSRDRLIQELIEQWIVMSDAKGAGFPEPSAQLVAVEEAKVTDQLGGSEAYAAKLRELGISAEDVRQLLSRQVFIERYLDHKFRPTVQIGESTLKCITKRNGCRRWRGKMNPLCPWMKSRIESATCSRSRRFARTRHNG